MFDNENNRQATEGHTQIELFSGCSVHLKEQFSLVNNQEFMRDIAEILKKLKKSEPAFLSSQRDSNDCLASSLSLLPLRLPAYKSELEERSEEQLIKLENNLLKGSNSDKDFRNLAMNMSEQAKSVDNNLPLIDPGSQREKVDIQSPLNVQPAQIEPNEIEKGANDRNHDNNNSMNCDSTPSTNQINDEDIKALVKELKRKIEYTERMNWLYALEHPTTNYLLQVTAGLSKRPMGPPHRKTSLPKHSDVKKRFFEICDTTFSEEVRSALRLPAFDSYDWDDAEVIHLMQSMFIELGLLVQFNIPVDTMREWLYEVYKHYNEVPFHNFRHCFCVAQMMYAIVWKTDLVNRLGHLEVLILLVSCICHDLDHPGYNNIYQINARTELALRYNDISPLENHHCSIAFRLFEHPETNIFKTFSKDTFKEIREGIIRCILATDMARHNEILTQFNDIAPTFDYSNKAHTNLLCMVLIKVADISNEARPMDVAEPWVDRLLQEFFAQSEAEKSEGLPVTPFMDPDKVSKPGSQVRFIGLVLLPLFESLTLLLTELNDFIVHPVRIALDYYKKLNDSQNRSRRSLIEAECSSEGGSPQMPRSQSGISVRSKKSIPSQKSTSRASVDEPVCTAAELHDLPEGSESGDSETATEVDVAEQTSKFKVDTESSGRISKSQAPHSRKTSKEKRPSMCVEMYSSSRMRGSYGNIHTNHRNNFGANRAVSLDQYRRMSSDGIQSVTSDSSVFYNLNSNSSTTTNNPITNYHNNHPILHQHFHPCNLHSKIVLAKQNNSSDVSGEETRKHPENKRNYDNTHTQIDKCVAAFPSVKDKKNSLTKREFRFRSLKTTAAAPSCSPSIPTHPNSDSKNNNNNESNQFAANPAPAPDSRVISSSSPIPSRSFISRLRQFTGIFNFTFDNSCTSGRSNNGGSKSTEQKRLSVNAPAAAEIEVNNSNCNKNNINLFNQTPSSNKNLNHKKLLSEFGSKTCCTSNMSMLKMQNVDYLDMGHPNVRNRAYSLDVPPKQRYSSGSSSRKSSASTKNDDDSSAFLQACSSANNNNNNNVTCSYCIAPSEEGSDCGQADKLPSSSSVGGAIKLKGGGLSINVNHLGVEEEVCHFIDDNVDDEQCESFSKSPKTGISDICNFLNNSAVSTKPVIMGSTSNLSKNTNT